MNNFAASTARKTRHLLGSILSIASMCFSAKTADEDTFEDAREQQQTCHVSHEIVKAELGKASKVVEQITHKQKIREQKQKQPESQQLQMVPMTWSVVSLESNSCDPSEFWDTRSADEEIDITEHGVPLAPPRTFQVKNVRFFREKTEKMETESKRKRFFRRRGTNNRKNTT